MRYSIGSSGRYRKQSRKAIRNRSNPYIERGLSLTLLSYFFLIAIVLQFSAMKRQPCLITLLIALGLTLLPAVCCAQVPSHKQNSRYEPVAKDQATEERLDYIERHYVSKDALAKAFGEQDAKIQKLSTITYHDDGELKIVALIGGAIAFLLGIMATQFINRLIGSKWPVSTTSHAPISDK